MKKLLGLALSLSLVMSFATPAKTGAWVDSGWRFSSGNYLDGTLTMCFEGNTFVYNNRDIIRQGFQKISEAVSIVFVSNGRCSSGWDGANIRVWEQESMPGFPDRGDSAWVVRPNVPWGGTASHVDVYFDADLDVGGGGVQWHVAGTSPVPNGTLDLRSVAFHEAGHAVGLDHDWRDNQQMSGPPNSTYSCFSFVGQQMLWLGQSDASGIRTKLAGRENYNIIRPEVGCAD